VERSGIDQPLTKAALPLKEVLTAVNPNLLIDVLDKALQERRTAVVLGAVRALGELADVGAARPAGRRIPALVRALNYPDRRVQIAAVDAVLRIPAPPAPLTSARVVEVLRRQVAADPVSRVLVADSSEDRGNLIAGALKQAGFDTVTVNTGRAALRRLAQSADIDAVFVDADIPDPLLPYLVAQLRSDINVGLLPVFVMTMPARIANLQRLLERYPNVWVVPYNDDPKDMKKLLAVRLTEAMGKPLTEAERKDYSARSMEWLARLARGEAPGYDIRPADKAIIKALHTKDLAALAVEACSRLPGRDAQIALADVVLDNAQPEGLRSAAAIELARSIQQYGLLLNQAHTNSFQTLFNAMPDSKLKANVSVVLGALRPDARQTGERLQGYIPSFSPPAKPATTPKPQQKDADSGAEKDK
jgi:CheY-like chemotaxis protein